MRVTVVAAAIVAQHRVLGARRRSPLALAGRWEFPGGKCEPGESDVAALVRECREELGVDVAVGRPLGEQPINADAVLRVYLATLVAGRPAPLQEHDELRWFNAADINDVNWLPPDRPFIDSVCRYLLPIVGPGAQIRADQSTRL